MHFTRSLTRPTPPMVWAWALPLWVTFCWPWAPGPSHTTVPFAVGLLAVALAGVALRPALPLAALAWFATALAVAWLSGGGTAAMTGLLAAAAAGGLAFGVGRAAFSQRGLTQALMSALVLAMVFNVAACWIQFFNFERAFDPLVNYSTGRPFGNLRQPNHLASFALMGLLAVWWRHLRRLDAHSVTATLAALAYSGVALSGSRTGLLSTAAVAVVLLLLRGRASRFEWCVFVAGPLWTGLMVLALPSIGGEAQTAVTRTGSAWWSHRLAYGREAWELALRHPLLGVGWGELGRARFEQLPPNPGLPNTENAHNLLLHLLAELGFAGAAVVLLPVASVLANQLSSRAAASGSAEASDRTWAWLLLTVVGLHSMVEFPLWYLPFLVPTAFAVGLLTGRMPSATGRTLPGLGVALLAGALLLCTVLVLVDYSRASKAYELAGASAARPLKQSLLFERIADRALVEQAMLAGGDNAALLAATARLLSNGPNPLILHVRLAALCGAGRQAEAWVLAKRFKALFPSEHAQFMARANPSAIANCGLPVMRQD